MIDGMKLLKSIPIQGCRRRSRIQTALCSRLLVNSSTAIVQTLAIFGLSIVTATSVAAEETYIQKGNSLSEQGQHELAAAMYTAWIGSHIDDPQAYYSRGCCYYSLGQYAKAIADYNKALTLKTDDATIYNNRGSAYEKLGQFDKGIADFDRAIAIKPDYASAYNNRANCYKGLRQVDKAIADHDRAISLDPSSQIFYVNRGNFYTELGKVDKAISDFDKAIALKPDCVDAYYAYYNRGTFHSDRGQYDTAITDFDKAIALKPDYPIPYCSRGNSYSKRKQFDKAIIDYSRAIALKPDFAESYHNRGSSYNDLGQFDKAIIDFDKAVALKPDNPVSYYNRGNSYRSLNQLEKAIADYDRAITLKPDFPGAYINRGLSYKIRGQLDKAIADYNSAIALNPDDSNAYFNRGNSYKSLEQLDNAIADYSKAITLKSDFPDAYYNRGNSYKSLGQFDKAAADFDRTITYKPDHTFAYYNRGEALARQKKVTESFQDFEHTFPQNATNSYFYSSRAVAQFISGDKSKGIADIEKALALAGADAQAKKTAEKTRNEFLAQTSNVASTSQRTQQANEKPDSTDPPPGVSKDRPIGDKWALVIGISKFANPAYNLKFAAKDAKDFYNYLITEGNFKKNHVLLLLDENATQRNIKAAFGRMFLPAVARDGDLVAIYVSTHGTPASKDPGKRNYIVAYDTNAEELYETGIDMDDLSQRVKEGVHTDRVLIVMDTCYSGGGVPGARGVDACGNFDAAQIAQGFGNLVISSSSPNERSWESKVSANGVFTKYLLQSLRLTHGNVKNAFDKLKDDVGWEVQNAFNQPQHPMLGGEWAGKELILSAPASTSRPILNPELLKLINLQNATTNAANPSQKIQATPKNTHH